jgi:hypothetical protein
MIFVTTLYEIIDQIMTFCKWRLETLPQLFILFYLLIFSMYVHSSYFQTILEYNNLHKPSIETDCIMTLWIDMFVFSNLLPRLLNYWYVINTIIYI